MKGLIIKMNSVNEWIDHKNELIASASRVGCIAALVSLTIKSIVNDVAAQVKSILDVVDSTLSNLILSNLLLSNLILGQSNV